MTKAIKDMSLEELWQLFPIILTPHQEIWKQWYQEEVSLLQQGLKDYPIVAISHIGSTSIPTIQAKPIIDILLEIPHTSFLTSYQAQMEALGYTCMSLEDTRISFNKGYTEIGFAQRVFHLHLRYASDNDELYFRDYLLDHLEVAQAYEVLKLSLWEQYEHDRDAYTMAKTEFIQTYTKRAKTLYNNRYRR